MRDAELIPLINSEVKKEDWKTVGKKKIPKQLAIFLAETRYLFQSGCKIFYYRRGDSSFSIAFGIKDAKKKNTERKFIGTLAWFQKKKKKKKKK